MLNDADPCASADALHSATPRTLPEPSTCHGSVAFSVAWYPTRLFSEITEVVGSELAEDAPNCDCYSVVIQTTLVRAKYLHANYLLYRIFFQPFMMRVDKCPCCKFRNAMGTLIKFSSRDFDMALLPADADAIQKCDVMKSNGLLSF